MPKSGIVQASCSLNAFHELEQYSDTSHSARCSSVYLNQYAPVTANGSQLAAVQNKRKEKARIAARARRSQEASIIMEMANELLVTQEKLRRIDKATIVKLAIDYIKSFEVLCKFHNISNLVQPERIDYIETREHIEVDNEDEQQKQSERQQEQQQEQRQREQRAQNQHQTQHQQQQNQHQQHHQPTQTHPLQNRHQNQQNQQQQQPTQLQRHRGQENLRERQSIFSAPKLATASIFAPKTADNTNSHFLMIEKKGNGKATFLLKPDTEILDEDDLTHLAPQAGDSSISLEAEPLDGIPLDDLIPKDSLHQLFGCTLERSFQ